MVGWCLAGACGPALALGFGDTRAQLVLGQPLNLAVPVTLGEGESLAPDCVGAEVLSGESRLPPGTVRARVTQGRDASEAVLRVVSTVPIDEPIVTLTLSAGCPTRITRTLVLLADPPLVMPTVQAAPATAAAPAPAPGAIPPAVPGAGAAAISPRAPATSSAPRATRPATPPRATRTATPRAAPPPASRAAVAQAPSVAAAPSPAPSAPKAEPPAAEGRPRLQLDAPLVSLSQAAAQAAEAQASAAQAKASEAEAAASAAQQRMRDMEAELARIRAEAKAQTDALVALRQQIAQDQTQRQQQTWMVPVLLAATVLLALVALWLAWRSRQQRPQPQRDVWWEHGPASVAAPAEDDSAFRASTLRPSTRAPLQIPSAPAPLVAQQRPAGAVGLDSLISPPTVAAPVAVTIPPAPPMPRDAEQQRAVTVDEQIDLEQQADFFTALGHDESAIDLLMAHLRSTGGGTPLPFLKLLEIHRRRGDREAYERTRVRFNQRFNSVAPDWTIDPKSGRSLEEYPLVVGRIQHAWSTPLDAMAELEALLFRRGAGAELFDLPAYQELLFLFQLARDLHQGSQPDDASDVDVLLPIGGATPPLPEGTIVLRPEFNAGEEVKLDLDLTNEPRQATAADAAKPDLEFDLGPDASKPADEGKDVWSDDPDDRRRE